MKNGILLVDKAAGVTSRDVDNAIQRLFQSQKVGHLGTLDPFATGLLILAVNKGTKYLPFLDDSKKSYLASLRLGSSTETGDLTGKTKADATIPVISDDAIARILSSFIGVSAQTPPMYSALKQDGVPLYKMAREGLEVERKARKIEIYDLRFLRYADGIIDFACTVSRGTYIRTLGEEIAIKLGTLGHLVALRRLSIGAFSLPYAKKIEELSELDIIDPTVFITSMKHVEVSEEDAEKVKAGQTMAFASADLTDEVLVCLHGEALAVYKKDGSGRYRCERGLF